MMKIRVEKVENSRIGELDQSNIQFGKLYSDHMYIADFYDGKWHDPRIVPYGNIEITPANQALHYGVSVFEGMKAYKTADGSSVLFRPLDNWRRLNRSADRLCMVNVPEEIFMEGIKELLKIDHEWIPNAPNTAMYVRPFLFAKEEYIGIKVPDSYRFMIITSPVGAYYSKPVKVKVEMEFARAVKGGTGFAKAAGNYAGALYPTRKAYEQGYTQLIWTDAQEHKYIEEAGTMNLFFEIEGKIVTPELTDTFLPGITRDSVLKLSRYMCYDTVERKITVDELVEGLKSGKVTDAFGVGTAATVTHISEIGYDGVDYKLPDVDKREKSLNIQRTLEAIKTGQLDDQFGWVYKV